MNEFLPNYNNAISENIDYKKFLSHLFIFK